MGVSRRTFALAAASATLPSLIRTQPQPKPAFDVASIKPTAHGRNAEKFSVSGDPATPSPGTFSAINNSLEELIRWAYRIKAYQISGPKWLSDDDACFDIEARMPPSTPAAQLPVMLQSLLEARFHLATHRETKMLPVYELTVAKGGARMTPPKPDAKSHLHYQGAAFSRLRAETTTASDLVRLLSDLLNRPVIDKTGIAAPFAVDLEYRNNDDDTTRPTLAETLQEKMGLRLDPAKGPVEFLIIDHIDRQPSAN